MKKNRTELVFILDRSGSMAGLEKDTIGGFNGMLEKQREQDDECLVSVVLFDHESQVLYDRADLEKVRNMTAEEYSVRGTTALLDAVGGAIRHIGNVHKYARREDVPDRTLFIITTDGMENASRRYNTEQIRTMISRQKERYGWEFLFIGANIDAAGTEERHGIGRERAANYHADARGTEAVYRAVSDAVTAVRRRRPLAASWSAEIDADFENRAK